MAYEIDESGTVTLGKQKVAVPRTISPEARDYLSRNPWGEAPMPAEPVPMWYTREYVQAAFQALNQQAESLFPVASVNEEEIGGVPCFHVRPNQVPEECRDRILINLHAGGFVLGSGSLVEAIPVAHLSQVPVIAVDYRLAPEHPYPAAVDDVIAVYKELLKTHSAEKIGIYGSSAGGILSAQALARIDREGLPMPACGGVFSGAGDLIDFGDTWQIYTAGGFYGHVGFPLDHELSEVNAYLSGADPRDPLISPLLADLSRFPPILLISGTRDQLLSGSANFHRALRRAGKEAELLVFDAMPHSHWFALHLPETREALNAMVTFFNNKLA